MKNNPINSEVSFLEKLKLHIISIPFEVLQTSLSKKTCSFNERVVIKVNDEIEWQAGTMPLGDGMVYVTISKERMKKIGILLGDSVTIQLRPDNSEFGLPIPKEFTIALELDPEAQQRFDTLKKGMQRNIIYQVNQYKTEQTRIDKSLFFLENLKRSENGKTTMRNILGKDLP